MALAAELDLSNDDVKQLAEDTGLHPHLILRKPTAPTIREQCKSVRDALGALYDSGEAHRVHLKSCESMSPRDKFAGGDHSHEMHALAAGYRAKFLRQVEMVSVLVCVGRGQPLTKIDYIDSKLNMVPLFVNVTVNAPPPHPHTHTRTALLPLEL